MAGFEHLYRQGAGEATVLNFGNVVNTYAQQLAMDAQKRQKEREAYAKELESISWEGARPADEEHFRKSWETVLDLNHKRSTTDKKEERIALSGQIAGLKKQMMADAKRSVLENATDADIAKMPLNKDIDELPDSFGDLLKARRSVSTFNPSFNEYGTDKFMVQPKPYDINADIMNTANIAANEVNEEYTIGSGIDARRGYREGKLLNEAKFKELILNRIATNSAAKRAYLQGAEPTPENLELAATAAYEAVKDKFSLKSREGNYIDPSGREIALYRKKAAISDSFENKDGAKTTQPIFRQDWINDMLDQTPGSGEQLLAIAEASGRFGDKKVKVITGSGGKVIGFKIPYEEATGKDGYNMIFNPNNRKEAAIKLNTLLNDLTGEKINQSTLMTEGGKKKVAGGKGAEGFENKTPAKSNGFSLDDYLKKKGLK